MKVEGGGVEYCPEGIGMGIVLANEDDIHEH